MNGEQYYSFGVQSVTYASPLLLASLGEVFSERVGVVNIGLEGMMLSGAFAAVFVAAVTHSPWLGLTAAVVVGALTGALFALFGVVMRRDQVIVGTTINFLALGLTGMLYRAWTNSGAASASAEVPTLPRVLGSGAMTVNGLTLVALALAPLAQFLIFRTRFGVALRAVGEKPAAAAASGTAIVRLRVLVCLLNGALCGAGGAALSIGINNTFGEGMTNGRGFIALAVVVFGRWKPWGALGASILFAAADVLQARLQTASTLAIPYPIILAIPYVLTLAALAIRGARSRAPAALGQAYEQG